MKKALTLLVVGAYTKELAPFCNLGRRHHIIQNDIGFLAAGIGPVASSFGLTHFLKDHHPETIIAIGTAGLIGSKHKIGDVVQVKSAHLQSSSDDTYFVSKMHQVNYDSKSSKLGKYQKFLKDIKKVDCYCPQEITKGQNLAAALIKQKYQAEHLEAYAYGFVAKKFKIPIITLLGLSNSIGPKAHEEWAKYENQATTAYSNVLNKIIKETM